MHADVEIERVDVLPLRLHHLAQPANERQEKKSRECVVSCAGSFRAEAGWATRRTEETEGPDAKHRADEQRSRIESTRGS